MPCNLSAYFTSPMGRGRARSVRVRGLCLSVKHLPPHPSPLPLVSLYGERQAFAFRERERCLSHSRLNSSDWESVAHESLFPRFGLIPALLARAARLTRGAHAKASVRGAEACAIIRDDGSALISGAARGPFSLRARTARRHNWEQPSDSHAAGPICRDIPRATNCNGCADGASMI